MVRGSKIENNFGLKYSKRKSSKGQFDQLNVMGTHKGKGSYNKPLVITMFLPKSNTCLIVCVALMDPINPMVVMKCQSICAILPPHSCPFRNYCSFLLAESFLTNPFHVRVQRSVSSEYLMCTSITVKRFKFETWERLNMRPPFMQHPLPVSP